ncbi:MAG: hypothetical protein ACYTEZ_00850 [Planctomycetota bacterium]
MAWIHDPGVPCNARQELLDVIDLAFQEMTYSYDNVSKVGSIEHAAAVRAVNCGGAPTGFNGLTLQEQCDHVAQAKVNAGVKDWLGVISELEAAGGGAAAGVEEERPLLRADEEEGPEPEQRQL